MTKAELERHMLRLRRTVARLDRDQKRVHQLLDTAGVPRRVPGGTSRPTASERLVLYLNRRELERPRAWWTRL